MTRIAPSKRFFFHRGDRAVHESGTVVDSCDFHARRELRANLLDSIIHPLGDNAAVFSREHESGSQHGLATVVRGGTGADALADFDIGQVSNAQRLGARAELHGQCADLVGGLHAAVCADRYLLAAELDDAATGIFDILADCVGKFLERDAAREKLLRLRQNRDLLFVSTRGVHLGDSGHAAEEWLHDEVVDQLQLHELLGAGLRLVRAFVAGSVINHVVVDFAEAGGDGSQLWRDAARQVVHGILQALAHELPCAEDVTAFLENEGDLRQAELRQRAQLGHTGDSEHLHLQRIGDELFDLLGSEAFHLGVDLDLGVRDVRHGVDGKPHGSPDARREEGNRREQHEGALAQRKVDDFLDHG